MYLLPAIDLKEGRCVRLKQGDMAQSTIFNDSPANQAGMFAKEGAEWIHVVDLDGAFAGKPVNTAAVESILKAADVKIELGGGIRSIETIRLWLEKGVARVILGTAALRDPELVKTACREFPDRIAVGIDAKDGFVAVEGWAETSAIKDVDLAKRFESAGVSAIIYTNVARDGVLQGPDLDSTLNLANSVSIPVIVSGGVSSLDDIKACRKAGVFEGVIAGRAIYEGRFTVSEAISVLKGE
ncbi:MAG: 1-(5-phosphoribosyl)-5-[(5-phosphoribosylamino)methylideneamino]imidazole-4-carboxamide isomerase [Alphaproteobacteria bacterium]|nr:1-(5-phosphoribosyl)-5-[(5-phosphoribosylamino)methylideneamino]imidazole-4-carboxamide isomerase [Alphaproteobacteria bacterium]